MRFIIINARCFLYSYMRFLDEKYHKLLQPFGLKKDKDKRGKDIFTIDLKNYEDLVKIAELTDQDIIFEHTSETDGYDTLMIYDDYIE